MHDALDSFRCCLDDDIEQFLRRHAFTFLERKWCSIYLLVDENAFEAGKIHVLAYFTLSLKSLVPSSASKTKIKEASGFADSETIPFVLIGQLGKYKEETEHGIYSADISGKEILRCAMEIIRAADSLIPCRCVLVECRDDEKIQAVYKANHFKFFQKDGIHNQLFRRVSPYEDEL